MKMNKAKRKNAPTVYSLAKHNEEIQKLTKTINRLTNQVKDENKLRCEAFNLLYKERDDHKATKFELEEAKDHLECAESALVYNNKRCKRSELIVDKLIGFTYEEGE